jgi:hypothetical protein
MERAPEAAVPYCVVAKTVFSSLRTQSVPETQAAWLVEYGWHVLIRESDLETIPTHFQSNPIRRWDPGDERTHEE